MAPWVPLTEKRSPYEAEDYGRACNTAVQPLNGTTPTEKDGWRVPEARRC